MQYIKIIRVISLIGLYLISAGSNAAGYPDRAVKIIVPFGAGSFTDLAARTLAMELTKELGQPVVVENKGGAGGTVGSAMVAKSRPDGYTLLVTDNSFVMSASLYSNLSYSPLKDIVQISQIAEAPSMMVARPGIVKKDLKSFVAYAKQKPGEHNFGSGGIGSSAHLAAEMFLDVAGLKMVHIPFKGVAASIREVMAERLDISMSSLASGVKHVKAGRVLGFAVSGDKRSSLLPDVPTFKELGFTGYTMSFFWGIGAPAGTPDDVVQRLNKAIVKASSSPKLLKIYADVGATAVTSSSAQMGQKVKEEIDVWQKIIKKVGVRIN